jgi:hypothetical protein
MRLHGPLGSAGSLLLVLVVGATPTLAQTPTGTITGTATDPGDPGQPL